MLAAVAVPLATIAVTVFAIYRITPIAHPEWIYVAGIIFGAICILGIGDNLVRKMLAVVVYLFVALPTAFYLVIVMACSYGDCL